LESGTVLINRGRDERIRLEQDAADVEADDALRGSRRAMISASAAINASLLSGLARIF
jgi:hypothetical protein